MSARAELIDAACRAVGALQCAATEMKREGLPVTARQFETCSDRLWSALKRFEDVADSTDATATSIVRTMGGAPR